MKHFFALGVFVGAIATGFATTGREAVLVDLMRVDSEFSLFAQRVGRIDGFLHYMAADALLLNRATFGPEEARAVWQQTDPKGLRLIWGATFADAAAAGDLGYTLGPWQREWPGPDGQVKTATGIFLTVWKRQPDDTWKFVIDGAGAGMAPDKIAALHQAMRSQPAPKAFPPAKPGPREALEKELRAVDRALSEAASVDGVRAAFSKRISDQVILLDYGAYLKTGALAALDKVPPGQKLSWEPLFVSVGASGDLGYTWGAWHGDLTAPDGKSQPVQGLYVSVWKRDADGEWRIAASGRSTQPPETIAQIKARRGQ
jgi:ketosteroid isomerase-like protein